MVFRGLLLSKMEFFLPVGTAKRRLLALEPTFSVSIALICLSGCSGRIFDDLTPCTDFAEVPFDRSGVADNAHGTIDDVLQHGLQSPTIHLDFTGAKCGRAMACWPIIRNVPNLHPINNSSLTLRNTSCMRLAGNSSVRKPKVDSEGSFSIPYA